MTPTTTPAPMTHEGDDVFIPKPCCIRADGACFEEGECLSDCEALDRDLLRGASERELRHRLERSERERSEWRTRADALAAEVESLRSRVEAAERERDAWMTEAKLLEHKTITCGVAATHPDADLTTRYPAEWDSPQHQAVRALRAKCAELEAVVGRCEALAKEIVAVLGPAVPRSVTDVGARAEWSIALERAQELREALRGQEGE